MPSRNTRKNRGNRRDRRNRRQYGGTQTFTPAPLEYSLSGSSPSNNNLAQGNQYASFHTKQHGGMAPYPGGVTDTVLPQDLQASARVLPLNGYLADVQYLRDPGQAAQAGGRRRRTRNSRGRFTAKRRGSKRSRKTRGSKRSRKTRGSKRSRKTRAKRNSRGRFLKMRGGSAVSLTNASDYDAPGMLLPSSAETKAVSGMNPEWKLAADPTSFAPRT
jgi:hypothetical protein